LLIFSVIAAAVLTLAFDQFRIAERKRVSASDVGEATQSPLWAPDPQTWRAAPLIAGKPAPDFDLLNVLTGERASLSHHRGRPVVLLLGSFGCNAFCAQLGSLIELRSRYQDRVEFLFVVIRDAGHPETGSPAHAKRLGPDASAEARLQLIREGLSHYKVPVPTLLDEHGDVERAYNAFPKRLILLDTDGRIAYDGGRGASGGPSDWDLAAVAARLDSLLGFTR
jgi:hypothetical protein